MDRGWLAAGMGTQKESRIGEGYLMPDHVHMMITIPPKYAVSQVIGYIKGKSAIHLARVYGERKQGFVGQHFWARGYFVSTVGRDEAVTRRRSRRHSGSSWRRLEWRRIWVEPKASWRWTARRCGVSTIMTPILPDGLQDFTDLVVPELQRRGRFRSDYTSSTLRGHLDLPKPERR